MIENWIENMKEKREIRENVRKLYGTKYGAFTWVRGSVDIFDLDDVEYVQICLKKMHKRIVDEKKEKKA